jgi:centromere/kinetochore protein ZW10
LCRKPATKLEKFSSKGKQGAKPPKIITQPPEPEPIRAPPKHTRTSTPNTSLHRVFNAVIIKFVVIIEQYSEPTIPIHPAYAGIDHHAQQKAPKEFYSVSSGMQDILELVENVMLESSEFSRSTLLAAYLPCSNSASSTSSTSGGTPGSVILNTVPSILDLFRALYPMTLQLELESGDDSQKGAGKSAATEGSAKKAIQFSNDCCTLKNGSRNCFAFIRVE